MNQIEITQEIKELAKSIEGRGKELLDNIREKIFEKIEFRPYDEIEEKKIHWKRTADEVLNDGYVYDGKACTDLVILFLALANARGFETKFVKLIKDKKTHSVAEIKINGDWYNFDVSKKESKIKKGKYESQDWKIWKRGRDLWDLKLET